MALDYTLEISMGKNTGKSGDIVAMTAKFVVKEGEIASVYAVEPTYGISVRLFPKGDGVYEGSAEVPWGAPAGRYALLVYGLDAQGVAGPKERVFFDVV